jgi:hypothetical protein
MEITKKKNLIILMAHFQKFFGVIDCGMKKFTWIWPSPVEISSNVVTPIIAVDHTIWVQHRYNFENECFS